MNISSKDDVCKSCSMIDFCSNLEQKNIHLTLHVLKKNEILCAAGEKFTHLYVVRQGALKSKVNDAQGFERIKYLYFKNEIYGFDAISSAYYPYETSALSTTTVCELPYSYFFELIQRQPKLLEQSLQLMSRQIASDPYPQHHSAQQKVSAFLLDLARRLDKKESDCIVFPMVYQDIAYYLNLSPETISRVFTHFKDAKIIAISKRIIRFLNFDKLKELAS